MSLLSPVVDGKRHVIFTLAALNKRCLVSSNYKLIEHKNKLFVYVKSKLSKKVDGTFLVEFIFLYAIFVSY